jgi:hypothetical protein
MATDDAAREVSKQATNSHRFTVRALLSKVAAALTNRGEKHDLSKLEDPELSLFAEWGPKLSSMKYGSPAYNDALKQMGSALRHHYDHNSHHPEHHGESGVDGMDLIDLMEMVCDWKASTLRVKDGDFMKSLETNRKRFNLSPQLTRIIANTAALFEFSDESVGPKLSDGPKTDGRIPWGKTAG